MATLNKIEEGCKGLRCRWGEEWMWWAAAAAAAAGGCGPGSRLCQNPQVDTHLTPCSCQGGPRESQKRRSAQAKPLMSSEPLADTLKDATNERMNWSDGWQLAPLYGIGASRAAAQASADANGLPDGQAELNSSSLPLSRRI